MVLNGIFTLTLIFNIVLLVKMRIELTLNITRHFAYRREPQITIKY